MLNTADGGQLLLRSGPPHGEVAFAFDTPNGRVEFPLGEYEQRELIQWLVMGLAGDSRPAAIVQWLRGFAEWVQTRGR